MIALLLPSCCDKSETSCYHLVTRLMTVTDLLQVVPTRLIQACLYNKLLLAYYYQSGNNLIRANISDLLEQLVASLFSSTLLQDDDNLFSASQQLHGNKQRKQVFMTCCGNFRYVSKKSHGRLEHSLW